MAGILAKKGSDVATVRPQAKVAEALTLLRRWGVGALVVSTDGIGIEGLVSERDVVRRLAVAGAEVLDREVREVMSAETLTCTLTDPVEVLMSVMTDFRVRHLPVVNDMGVLCGIVSIGDVVKSRVEDLEREQAQLIDYVRTGR